MNWPLDKQNVPGRSFINPMASVPLEQFGRSLDRLPKAQGNGGGGNDFVPPMWLISASSTEVLVTLATVNGATPTDIDTPIDVSGSDGTWAIYMHVSISGTTASSPEVLSNSAGTVPSDTTTDSYRLIGEVDVSSGVITAVRPSIAWSQNVTVCTADTPPYAWTTGA